MHQRKCDSSVAPDLKYNTVSIETFGLFDQVPVIKDSTHLEAVSKSLHVPPHTQ